MSNSNAANEESSIISARRSLLAYARLRNNNYKAPRHIVLIARALNDVMLGKVKRLIITMPPRHGKSMISSQFFPAWYMGHYPDRYIITATYGQDLANDFGRKVRDQIQDPTFQKIFPDCVMKNDTTAAQRFNTTKEGAYFAVGAGGAITGRGGHLLLIDDIFKNRQEADSLTVRESRLEWYRSVAYTRLMPGGAIVMITTRWGEDDLVGYVIKNHGHERWAVLTLPAISANGEALWPEQYPLDVLQNIKETTEIYDWHCLYQQNPIPREGNIFKLEWLKDGIEPDYAAYYIAIDPAISQGQLSDETSITVIGVGYGENPTIDEIETVYGKWEFDEQVERLNALYQKYNKTKKFQLIGVESVAYQKALYQRLHRLSLPVIELKVDKDKVRRAFAITHLFTQGRVRINTPKLREQLLRFRGVEGEKNDLVDSFVHCAKMTLDYSSERYEKPGDEFAGLDPKTDGASIVFWKAHKEEMEPKGSFTDYFKQIL